MTPATKVVLWTLALLSAAEYGLRKLDAPVSIDVAAERPILICLGTSRTTHGLSPLEIEATLAGTTSPDAASPWVANESRNGITTVGLYLLYMKEVRPLLRGRSGVIAIEARPSGFNDAYMTEEENRAFAGSELRALYAGGDIRLDDFAEDGSARNQFAAFADRILSGLRLSGGRALLARVSARLSPAGTHASLEGARGFLPVGGPRRDDLDVDRWRYHYEKVLLNGWRFGVVQTLALRFLIRQIKTDGFTPVLYVMPVTAIQRSFWPDHALPIAMAGIRGIAAEEGVDLEDFDRDHALQDDAFHDTHHLTAESAHTFSRQFARRVFAPRMPE